MKQILLLFITFASGPLFAQSGTIKGTIIGAEDNEPVGFATIYVLESEVQALSDIDGSFTIEGLEPGIYSLEIKATGFESVVYPEIMVSNSRTASIEVRMNSSVSDLEEVEVRANAFETNREAPVSYQTLGAAEIERFPGANRDVSRVIRALPGVAAPPSFRNDIIIRGGAPGENRFFLDGIEIPVINHFQTQGSSGGPVGILNVNFIRDVEFYSGAFPSNRGNALSSVFEFTQKEGNPERMIFGIAVGSSDIALNLDGPLGKKANMIFSYRRSYLQFLFAALRLPFLPTYNDSQFRIGVNFNEKNRLTLIGLGALDDFALNLNVNDGVSDAETLERNNYFLNNIPIQTQWNYTVGARFEHFFDNGVHEFVASRSHLNNESVKYFENDETQADNLILDYRSQEIENKFRYELKYYKGKLKLNVGAGYQQVGYTNRTFNRLFLPGGVTTINYNTEIGLNKYALFAQASYTFGERLSVSGGIRLDGNDFASTMENPLDQFSPRLSLSYALNENVSLSANAGRYYQLPPYTVLGFRDNNGLLVNRATPVSYIQCDQVVAGVSFNPGPLSKISIETFYKWYDQYPFSLTDSISLANLGADFGVIGNEPVESTSRGRAYGVEFLARQKLKKGFYGLVSYTLVRSEFEDKNGEYIPSAWDFRHVVSLTGGKKFKNNWDLGVRWLFSGGAPYTPYDIATSSLQAVWDVTQMGLLDFSQLNTLRLGAFHQLDIRVDKKWFFEKWSINLYLDIQNLYGFAPQTQDFLLVETDDTGNPVTDPNDPSRYSTKLVSSSSGTVVPTLGIIVEF